MTIPACLTIGGRNEAVKLKPRGNGGEFDGAASCRAYGPDMDPPTQFPPVCLACVRRVRAELILAKEIEPHPPGALAAEHPKSRAELLAENADLQAEVKRLRVQVDGPRLVQQLLAVKPSAANAKEPRR